MRLFAAIFLFRGELVISPLAQRSPVWKGIALTPTHALPARASSPGRFSAPGLTALVFLLLAACALPGPQAKEVEADSLRVVLAHCAEAAEGMHFKVKAVDRSHHIVIAEGRVEGGLSFHEVRLSIKVTHIEGRRYEVEAIATADERGIREGAEKKARKLFFRELRESGIMIEG